MGAPKNPRHPHDPSERDYKTLPPPVQLDDTVATIDADPVPDPTAGRNVEQHAALRDD
jgi:hypothetical protein